MKIKAKKRIFIYTLMLLMLSAVLAGCNVRIVSDDNQPFIEADKTTEDSDALEITDISDTSNTTEKTPETAETITDPAGAAEKLTEPKAVTIPTASVASPTVNPADYIYKEDTSAAVYAPLKTPAFKTFSVAEKPLTPDLNSYGARCFFNDDKVETEKNGALEINYSWQEYGNKSKCLMILVDTVNEFGGANSSLYLPKYGLPIISRIRGEISLDWSNPSDFTDLMTLTFTVGANELLVIKNTPQYSGSYTVKLSAGVIDDGSFERFYLPLYAIINETGGGVILDPFGDGSSFIYTGDAIQGYSGKWETSDRGDERQNVTVNGKTVSIPEYWRQLELSPDGTFVETTRGYNTGFWDVVKYSGQYAFAGRILAMKYIYQTRYDGADYNNLKTSQINEPYAFQEAPNEPAIIPGYVDEWDPPEYLFMRNRDSLYSRALAKGDAAPETAAAAQNQDFANMFFTGVIKQAKFYHDGRGEWISYCYADVGKTQYGIIKSNTQDFQDLGQDVETEIQVYSAADNINLNDYIGKKVSFKGFCFAAQTVYHQRNIVFGVTEIRTYTPITTDEARTLVSGLWDKFVKVRSFYSNDGLPADYKAKPFKVNNAEYHPVTGDIKTIAELKRVTEQTVTKEFAENNFYAYAIESDIPLYIEKDGVLYISAPSGIGFPKEWRFETLAIKEQSENILTVTAEEYIWTTDETMTGEISLVKTVDGWRLGNADY